MGRRGSVFPGLAVPGAGGRRGSTFPAAGGARGGHMLPGLSVSPSGSRRGSRAVNSLATSETNLTLPAIHGPRGRRGSVMPGEASKSTPNLKSLVRKVSRASLPFLKMNKKSKGKTGKGKQKKREVSFTVEDVEIRNESDDDDNPDTKLEDKSDKAFDLEEIAQKDTKAMIAVLKEREQILCAQFQGAVVSNNGDRQSKVLQQLGEIHMLRGRKAGRLDDFPRAVGLLNCAMHRTTSDEQVVVLKNKITEVEKQFLSCLGVGSKDKAGFGINGANKHKKSLLKMREEVQRKVDSIREKMENVCLFDDKDIVNGQEDVIVEETHSIGHNLKRGIRDMLKQMIASCKEALGAAPCKYAILGLGPVATEECTPYTDIELAILIEEGKARDDVLKYFRNLTRYLHMKITNLGETPLTATGVRLFHDFYNQNMHCFMDTVTTNGVQFDCSRTSTSITPLGFIGNHRLSKSLPSIEFIKTPKNMAQYFTENEVKRVGGTVVCRLIQCTLVDGDDSLMKEFEKCADEVLSAKTTDSRVHLLISLDIIDRCLRDFDIPYNSVMEPHGIHQLDMLRRDIEMFPNILHAVKLSHRLLNKTPWAIIENLKTKLLVNEDGRHNFRVAEAFSLFMTAQWHMAYGGKSSFKDVLKSPHPSKSLSRQVTTISETDLSRENTKMSGIESKPVPKVPDIRHDILQFEKDQTLYRYYCTLLPLVEILQQSVRTRKRPVFSASLLYKEGNLTRAHTHYRLLRLKEARNSLQHEVDSLQNFSMSGKSEQLFDLHTKIGIMNYQLRKSREATNCFTKAMEQKDGIADSKMKTMAFVQTWYNFALPHLSEGKFKKTFTQLKDSLDVYKQMTREVEECEFGVKVFESIGVTKYRQGHFKEALASFERAIEISKKVSSNDISEERVVLSLHMMGKCQAYLGDYKASLVCYRQALDLQQSITGSQHISFNTLAATREMGIILLKLGKKNTSSIYLHYATHMSTFTLGSQLARIDNLDTDRSGCHPEIVYALSEYASCCSVAPKSDSSRPEAICMNLYKTIFELIKNTIGNLTLHMDLAHMLFMQGRAALANNLYDEALDCLQQAIKMSNKLAGKEKRPHFRGQIFKCMGTCNLRKGKFDETLEYYQKAMKELKLLFGQNSNHPEICDIVEYMGHLYSSCPAEQGSGEEAMDMFKKSLEMKKQVFGQVHPSIALTLAELGKIYKAKGDLENSSSHYLQALEMQQRLHGDDLANEDIASITTILAGIFKEMGEPVKVQQYMTKALELWRHVYEAFPNRVQNLLAVMEELGNMYRQLEKYEDATFLHKEAFDIIKKETKYTESQLAAAAASVAQDYKAAGLYSDAIKMYAYAIETKKCISKTAERETIELAIWLGELGKVYDALGEHEKASENHLQSLYMKRKILGKEAVDEEMITSLEQIAKMHERKGDYRKAIALRKKSLARSKQLHKSKPHIETVQALESLGFAYYKVFEYDNALHYQVLGLDMLLEIKDENTYNTEVSSFKISIGKNFESMGEYERAITYYEESLAILQKLHSGEIHEDIATCVSQIGHAMNSSGDCESAIKYLKSAVDMMQKLKLVGQAREKLANALYNLGLAYEIYPDNLKALQMHEEAMKIRKDVFGKEPKTNEKVTQSLRALGRVHCALDKPREGVTFLEKALQGLRSLYGAGVVRLEISYAMDELGLAYAIIGNVKRAMEHQTKALHMMRQIFGHKKPHLHVAKCLGNLAVTSKQAKNLEEAITYATQSIYMFRQMVSDDEDHPTIAALTLLLAEAYLEQRKYVESAAHFRNATKMFLSIHDGDALNTDVISAMKKFHEVQHIVKTKTVVS